MVVFQVHYSINISTRCILLPYFITLPTTGGRGFQPLDNEEDDDEKDEDESDLEDEGYAAYKGHQESEYTSNDSGNTSSPQHILSSTHPAY